MNKEVLSVTIVEPFENKEEAALQLLRELYNFMAKKGYSHDLLYRDPRNARRLVHLRIWKSVGGQAGGAGRPPGASLLAALAGGLRDQQPATQCGAVVLLHGSGGHGIAALYSQ